jgi:hypothetical protein
MKNTKNLVNDWHNLTQNQEYLELQKNRLADKPLIWVTQFKKIIKNLHLDSPKINDIGCCVGHFFREIEVDWDYVGYDISDTYLRIARENFDGRFYNLDISKSKPRLTNVSIISATFEIIEDHQKFIENVFTTTENFVVLRTLIGDTYREDLCKKNESMNPYKIKQFTVEQLEILANKSLFHLKEVIIDEATNGEEYIYPLINLPRKQQILLFEKIID